MRTIRRERIGKQRLHNRVARFRYDNRRGNYVLSDKDCSESKRFRQAVLKIETVYLPTVCDCFLLYPYPLGVKVHSKPEINRTGLYGPPPASYAKGGTTKARRSRIQIKNDRDIKPAKFATQKPIIDGHLKCELAW